MSRQADKIFLSLILAGFLFFPRFSAAQQAEIQPQDTNEAEESTAEIENCAGEVRRQISSLRPALMGQAQDDSELSAPAPDYSLSELLRERDSFGEGSSNPEDAGSQGQDDAEDSGIKFGSLTAKLTGGKLTSYSYSTNGLDLSEKFGDLELMVLMRKETLNVKDVERNKSSLRDKFYKESITQARELQRQSLGGLADEEGNQGDGGSYQYQGIAMGFDVGGWRMDVLNFEVPPKHEVKAFKGTNSTGPYDLHTTNILDGSEKVYMEGTRLGRGVDYDINYIKGEIEFTFAVDTTDEIRVEYESMGTGSDRPREFTGVRVSGEGGKFTLGGSMFREEEQRFENRSTRELSDYAHSLWGFDGGFETGKHSVSFEYATSTSEMNSTRGNYSTQTFTTLDSEARDGNPKGPYYLDEDRLPAIENTAMVLVNDAQMRDRTAYYLDIDTGRLTFKDAVNLSPLDIIEVRWYYEEAEAAPMPVTDSAYMISMDNGFGGFTHTLELSHAGPSFVPMGGKGGHGSDSLTQTLSGELGFGMDFNVSRKESETVYDAETSAGRREESFLWDLGYQPFKELSINYKSSDKERTETGANPGTSTDTSTSFGAKYKTRAFSLGFDGKENSSQSTGASTTVRDNRHYDIDFSTRTKTVQFQASYGWGDKSQSRGEDTDTTADTSLDIKLRYMPSKNMTFMWRRNDAEYDNEPAADKSSFKDQYMLQWNPMESLRLQFLMQKRSNTQGDSVSDVDMKNLQVNYKLSEKWDLSMRRSEMTNARTGTRSASEQQSYSATMRSGLLPEMALTFKYDLNDVSSVSERDTGVYTNDSQSVTTGFKLDAEPLWDGKKFSWEFSDKGTDTSGTSNSSSGEVKHRWEIELPVLWRLSPDLDYTRTKRGGSAANLQEELNLVLASINPKDECPPPPKPSHQASNPSVQPVPEPPSSAPSAQGQVPDGTIPPGVVEPPNAPDSSAPSNNVDETVETDDEPACVPKGPSKLNLSLTYRWRATSYPGRPASNTETRTWMLEGTIKW